MTRTEPSSRVRAKAAAVRLVLFDVDGVLTDGALLMHADGSESKRFHVRDGTGLVLARRAGLVTGLLSGRRSAAAQARAAELGVSIVRLGVESKREAFEQILAEQRLEAHQVAFMGDDVPDLPVLARAGLSAAPADAAREVLALVDWVAPSRGGEGAARDMVEMVLMAQQRWAPLVDALQSPGGGEDPNG